MGQNQKGQIHITPEKKLIIGKFKKTSNDTLGLRQKTLSSFMSRLDIFENEVQNDHGERMTQDGFGGGREMIWGSAQGRIRSGSLQVDAGGVSGIIDTIEGAALIVRAGPEHTHLLSEASRSDTDIILRGQVLGSREEGDIHLSVLILGPAQITGPVSDIRRGEEADEPFVEFFVLNEVSVHPGSVYTIPVGVRATGPFMEGLETLNEGDMIQVEGRDSKYGYTAVSRARITPGAQNELSDNLEP